MEPLFSREALSVFFDGTFSSPRLAHPEGVAVHADGSVWAGTENGDLVRIAADGSSIEALASWGGFLLGIAFDGPATATPTTSSTRRSTATRRRLAASKASPHRGLSCRIIPSSMRPTAGSTSRTASTSTRRGGGVYRYDLKTGEGGLWTREKMHFANGMAMARDGRGLYVVESTAACLSLVPIGEDGAAGVPEVVVEGLEAVPDGVLVMDNGDLLRFS